MSLSLRSDSDQAVIVRILTEAEALDEKAQGELRAAMAESPDDPPEILLAAHRWASEEAITSAHGAHLRVGSYAFEDPDIVEETPAEEAPEALRVIEKDAGGETVETVSFGQFLERVSTLSQRVSETFCRDSWCFPLETEDAKVELVCLNPSEFTACGDDCPVEEVSFFDAVLFANAKSASEGLEPCYNSNGNVVGDPDGNPYRKQHLL